MLSFVVYSNGKPAEAVDLAGAYVVGTDDVPLRADITFKGGVITCKKRAAGPAGLALLWNVEGVGRVLIETVRVPERERPYILQVELARARLMRINNKLEDWGLLDYDGVAELATRLVEARQVLIKALQADTFAQAAALGDQALSIAARAGDELSAVRADQTLERRRQVGGAPRRFFGCTAPLDKSIELIGQRLSGAFDFVTVPLAWRDIEPNEQTFNWKPLDTWVEALTKEKIPIKGSALLSFHEKHVPDWLYIWEHDFDTIRDLAFEHVRRVINRYGQYIQSWDVISGIHANNCFTFNFEQLMELTRMAAALTKQLSRRSMAVIEFVAPWGEYYARNQRTIPPLLYADMAVQSGVSFDAFGLQCIFGPGVDGMFVRDMFQISTQLDLFAKLGKPVHVTAVQVPSAAGAEGGHWGAPWSEKTQERWVERFLEVVLSKPFVESVAWRCLIDGSDEVMPSGGLLHEDLSPKAAYQQWIKTRTEFQTAGDARPSRS